MIKKINKIHYKCFNDYDASGLVFGKINLIFGFNGNGKSSFKHFLYDEIQAINNNETSNIQHSQEKYKIFLYDEDYKRNTLYINSDNEKKGFSGFYLGDDIRQIITNREAILASIEKANQKIERQNFKLETYEKNIDGLKQDIAKNTRIFLEPIDKSYKIPQKYTKANILDEQMNEALEILSQNILLELQRFKINEIPSTIEYFNFEIIKRLLSEFLSLETTLKQIPENAAIERFKVDPELEIFAKMAISIKNKNPSEYIEKCPLCEQNIATIGLWNNLDKHFNQEYNNLIQKLENIKTFFNNANESLVCLNDWINTNFISGRILYDTKENNIDEIRKKYLEYIVKTQSDIKIALNKIEEKIKNPSSSNIILDIDSKNFSDRINELISDSIKNIVVAHNSQQEKYETTIQSNIAKIKSHFMAEKRNDFLNLKKNVERHARNKERFKKCICKYNEQIMQLDNQLREKDESFKSLNQDLSECFAIKDIKFEKVSESYYKTQRQDCEGNWFDCKSGLSEGEKTMVCVIYFINSYLSYVQQESECPIVIIDDPITSLDDCNRDSIKNYVINKIVNKLRGQFFILSHDNYFLEKSRKGLSAQIDIQKYDIKLYKISRQNLESSIREIDKFSINKNLKELCNELKNCENGKTDFQQDDIRKFLEMIFSIIFENDKDFTKCYKETLEFLRIEPRYTANDIHELNHSKTDIDYLPELCNKAKFAAEIYEKLIKKITHL